MFKVLLASLFLGIAISSYIPVETSGDSRLSVVPKRPPHNDEGPGCTNPRTCRKRG